MSTTDKKPGILLKSGTNEVEFLVINIGKHLYGINVSKVRTIQVYDSTLVSPVPHQKPELLGLMPYRDLTISIVDLKINLAVNGVRDSTQPRLLLVTEFNNRTTGFVVDGVSRIERCSWEGFEPITDSCCNTTDGGIVGTVKLPEGLVIILDLESIIGALDPSMSIENYARDIEKPTIARDGIRIVHCDDSVVIRKLVYKILVDAGFPAPVQFDNGADTLDYINKTGETSANIIISDIEMPRMDGLALCKNLKDSDVTKRIPLLFFSSMINKQMLEKCRSVGGDGAFSKPQINFLVNEIETLLQQ
jgi:two-component system, chemotaxis family, chemotaxis protein CheV